MQRRGFEWDDHKARLNFAKHKVRFSTAQRVFSDPLALDLLDDRDEYDEERWNMIGSTGRQILFVVYTEREGYIRIISARRATKREQDAYWKQAQE